MQHFGRNYNRQNTRPGGLKGFWFAAFARMAE